MKWIFISSNKQLSKWTFVCNFVVSFMTLLRINASSIGRSEDEDDAIREQHTTRLEENLQTFLNWRHRKSIINQLRAGSGQSVFSRSMIIVFLEASIQKARSFSLNVSLLNRPFTKEMKFYFVSYIVYYFVSYIFYLI